jgi:excisionase family DNA binding protein
MTEDRREFLLLDEVAREYRASVASLRYWIARGRLRSVRPGRRRLVSRENLERFIATGGRPVAAPGDAPAGASEP